MFTWQTCMLPVKRLHFYSEHGKRQTIQKKLFYVHAASLIKEDELHSKYE